ncbi:hypothetical protein [Sporosarcina sp. P21c]|uniref:hypothetical protein n=1 Tax=Sporosarcina sp. P21c TaxID=2048255 RepID=UPI00117A953B|nr:hypothetical protein [Sporosarcina sp. P21c]
MYDINQKVVTNKDLQNKSAWCAHGESKEKNFVREFGRQLGLKINPEKENNKYAPDLAYVSNNGLADLKTQNTPFFTAAKYNCNPSFTVTFNRKDADRYRKEEPKIDIYFWVNWIAVRYFRESSNLQYNTDINVEPLNGIWRVSFTDLDTIIGKSPLHQYQQRVNDTQGNAKESYLINLCDPLIQRIF